MERLADKISRGERITPQEAMELWNMPLARLGALAFERKKQLSSDLVFYNKNFHIEPTNICSFNCKFCSYRRDADSSEAWDMTLEQIESMAERYSDSDVTEVHIVGAVHPDRDINYYIEMVERVHRVLPQVSIKCFSAVELGAMILRSGLDIEQGLRLLQKAGMAAIPGGGAEIFTPKIRDQICPDKGSTALWFEVHDKAHRLGIKSNATMLYGHIESVEDRVDHLDRLRNQQDLTGGFDAFIPLKYRSKGNSMSDLGEVSIIEDLRLLAISRLYLDNFPHIKAYWAMYGKSTAELSLSFGADDLDGTIDDTTKIYSMAGAEDSNPKITVSEIEAMCHSAGLVAVERDTFYNLIKNR